MTAHTLIHYHAFHSRSSSIRWLFHELGMPPHEVKILDLQKGEQKSPAYLAINPMGKVPAVAHDGTVITESAAIAIYLADLFPEAGLAPKIGERERGTYLRWLIFNQAVVEPAVTDQALKREPGPSSTLAYGTYETAIDTLAGAIGKGPYLLGPRFSAADVIVGMGVRWMLQFKLLPERDEFVSYVARLNERPALKAATQEEEKAKLAAGVAG